MKRLVLIDGNAILHRAYHALPPLTTSKGELVNAVFGFVSMLLRVVNDLKPTHLAVCFDTPKPTFRNKMYKDYQATRPKMEENLASQIGLVHKVVEEMRIPIYEMDGYEADDIIGTLAFQTSGREIKNQKSKIKNTNKKLKKTLSHSEFISRSNEIPKQVRNDNESDVEVIIVTGDRDLLQLVSDRVKLYMPVKGLSQSKLFGEKEVEEKFGVSPRQIVDYKALVGDPSDNYPGVRGIGPKTASQLLQRFETLEKLYDRVCNIESEKVRKALNENEKSAEMAKKLAMIVTDAPIEVDLEKCQLQSLDRLNVHRLFEELEFRSLIPRLGNRIKNDELRIKNKEKENKNDGIEQIKLF